MKTYKKFFSVCILGVLIIPFMTQASDGNWKTGRIYYRMVCTDCHKDQSSGAISPSSKTMAEWAAYIDTDSHAQGKDKVSYYVSKEYRESIKTSNRAAAKFLNVPAPSLMSDVKAFVIHGAKDSNQPALCD